MRELVSTKTGREPGLQTGQQGYGILSNEKWFSKRKCDICWV